MAETKEIKIGVDTKSCRTCGKQAAAMVLGNLFDQAEINGMFWFSGGVMRLNEVLLMRAVQLINPYQEEYPIELFRLEPDGSHRITARRTDNGD